MKKVKGFLIAGLSVLLLVSALSSCSKDGGNGDGPQIATVTPSSGLTGATVVITGKNLSDASVMIGGIATGLYENSATTISTSIPAGVSAGQHKLVVTTPEGSDEASITVTGAGAAPVITTISPAEVSIGQSITINGTALANATVQIATKVAQVTNNTTTSITVVIPPAIALGSAAVKVITPLGTFTSTVIIK